MDEELNPMLRTRRKFLRALLLAGGGAVAGGAYWVGTSRRRSARMIRQMVADSRRSILPPARTPNPGSWSENAITICWLGHATVLIKFYGLNVLIDPIFSERVGIDVGIGTLGPKRYIGPALRAHELPPIDVLLLSHAHMDHIDLPSLKRLPPTVPTVTAKLTQDLLTPTGLQSVQELGWGERTSLRTTKGDIAIEAFEVRHWGRRWPSDLERGYNGYLLRREGKALVFGGDTADTPLFKPLRSRGPFEAAIMPIGAYNPWIRSHCTPEQAWQMFHDTGAQYLVPVHHLTFKLSEEPMGEPLERLEAAAQMEPERLALRKVGEHFVCPV